MIYPAPLERMTIEILPAEILHQILLYYTNDFAGLIHFSSVCKEWKEVVAYSSLWFTTELSFYAPTRYFQLYENSPEERSHCERRKRNRGDTYPLEILLSNTNSFLFEAKVYKIIIRRTTARQQSFHTATMFEEKEGESTNDREENNTNHEHDMRKDSLSKQEHYTLSNDIKNEILPIFRSYQRLWQWYCHWIPFFQTLLVKTRFFISIRYLKYAIILNFVCKAIAITAFFLSVYFPTASTTTTAARGATTAATTTARPAACARASSS